MNLMNFFSSMTSNISDISSGSSLLRQPTFLCNIGGGISIPDLKISEPRMVDPRISLKPYTTVSKTPTVHEMLRGTSFSNYDDEPDWTHGKPADDEPDRVIENPDNGKRFYGYDDDEGRTKWYDEDGNLECTTDTPDEDAGWTYGKTADDEPDWVDENPDDGKRFYGYDDDEGHTEWYDEDGNLDCITDTPDEDAESDDYLQHY